MAYTEKVGKMAKFNAFSGFIGGLILGLFLFYFVDLPLVFSFEKALMPLIDFFSSLYRRLLELIISPLMICAAFLSICKLKNFEDFFSLSKKTISFFFLTSVTATFFGLVVVNMIRPGDEADLVTKGISSLNLIELSRYEFSSENILNFLQDLIPKNPFESLGKFNLFQIYFLSLFMGIIGLIYPTKSKSVIEIMDSFESMLFIFIQWVVKLVPLGVFFMTLTLTSKKGPGFIFESSSYFLTVIGGLFAHFSLLLMMSCLVLKKGPWFIIKKSFPVLILAFNSSSRLSMPMAMLSLEEHFKIDKRISRFTLSLGTLINMNGTAVCVSIGAIFIAQAYGVPLNLIDSLLVLGLTFFGVLMTGGANNSGIYALGFVLSLLGLPLEGMASILLFDKMLGMFRNSLNIFGDMVVAILVDSSYSKK